jgi:putative spermidine/putrescine transport system substrate-binding protein
MSEIGRRAGMTRRGFNAMLGSGVAAGVLGAALPAGAAGGRVVVGTWGGDYEKFLDNFIAKPLLAPKGYQVVYDTANDTARRAKLLAEKRLPRGTMDIAALTAPGSYEMWTNGVLEELDEKKVPNLKNVVPALRTKYSVPHIWTGRVILYNPKRIQEKPASYADLWNPKYAGKVGVIDIQYLTTIESAAMISGGGLDNYEPGKAKLLELKKMGVKIYPTNEAMAQALKTEDCWMCIMWKARGVQWQNAGVPVEIAAPKEGLVAYVSDFSVPKNAPNKAAAYAYLNATLEPPPQIDFAKNMGYNPSAANVRLPADLEARIGFPPGTKILTENYDYIAKHDSEFQEWWNKDFKA